MKTQLYLSAALLPWTLLQGATWTVDNDIDHPADFRTIQAAVDMASAGDTILVSASHVYYPGFTSTKRLTIRGERSALSGLFTGVGGSIRLNEFYDESSPDHLRNAGDSLLEALTCQSIAVEGPCSGVRISRCYAYSSGITLRGCSGTLIANCRADVIGIHNGGPYPGGRNYTGSNNRVVGTWARQFYPTRPANTLAENCVFGFHSGASPQSDPLRTEEEYPLFTVVNSIIISKTSMDEHISRGIFDHCLSLGPSTLSAERGNINLPYSSIGNVFTSTVAYTSTTHPPASAFVLAANSPAIGTGLNGADMGIYGGSHPFVPDQVPALPRILTIIVPPLVPDSSGLTFEVEAEARD